MEPRIKHPAQTLPGAMQALQSLDRAAAKAGVPEATFELMKLRAGQINGCSGCVDIHSRILKALGEPDERVFMVGAWRESTYYSAPERAALALAEAVTRLADRPDPVSDEIWAEAAFHYDDDQLAALVLSIAVINSWNRMNVATRQPTGEWVDELVAQTMSSSAG